MSLDPKTLKKDDRVKFGGVIREIEFIEEHIYENAVTASFVDGFYLTSGDPLWELAELVNPELPTEFSFGYLGVDNNYHTDGGYVYTPKRLLKFLKKDVAALERAGVKESD